MLLQKCEVPNDAELAESNLGQKRYPRLASRTIICVASNVTSVYSDMKM